MAKRLKLGMIGGGQGAFIGAVHRLCARMDDKNLLLVVYLQLQKKRQNLLKKLVSILQEVILILKQWLRKNLKEMMELM